MGELPTSASIISNKHPATHPAIPSSKILLNYLNGQFQCHSIASYGPILLFQPRNLYTKIYQIMKMKVVWISNAVDGVDRKYQVQSIDFFWFFFSPFHNSSLYASYWVSCQVQVGFLRYPRVPIAIGHSTSSTVSDSPRGPRERLDITREIFPFHPPSIAYFSLARNWLFDDFDDWRVKKKKFPNQNNLNKLIMKYFYIESTVGEIIGCVSALRI